MRYLICIVRWSIINIELVEITNSIGTNWKKKKLRFSLSMLQCNRNRELDRYVEGAQKGCTLLRHYYRITSTTTYLASCPCNFVNYIGENHVLVIGGHANLLPLRILSQSNIIPKKRMANAAAWKIGARKRLIVQMAQSILVRTSSQKKTQC